MEWVETTGKTVAEAKEAALDELGVDERDAEVLVVAEPRSGLFGIGRVDARVRARVRPAAPRPKRPQRSRRGENRSRGSAKERASTSSPEERPERSRQATGEGAAPGGSRRRGRGRGRSRTGEGGQEPATAAGASTERPAARGGRNGSRDTKRADRDQDGTVAAGKRPAARTEESEMTIEQQAAAVERFVSGVVERFGYGEAKTSVRVEDDHVLVDVTGDDLGLLVGPRGRTLDALQELARTVVQRRGEEGGTRVVVDVAGYRAKRTAALEAFVRRVAADVLEQGEAQALEAMGAADRKIVHDTVTTIDGVETSSEGFEPNRYVVIRPSGQAGAASEAADA